MSDPIDDGGPAFPITTLKRVGAVQCSEVAQSGMSIRDWLAGQALAGMLGDANRSGTFEDFATDAYSYADAMLAERKRGGAS